MWPSGRAVDVSLRALPRDTESVREKQGASRGVYGEWICCGGGSRLLYRILEPAFTHQAPRVGYRGRPRIESGSCGRPWAGVQYGRAPAGASTRARCASPWADIGHEEVGIS